MDVVAYARTRRRFLATGACALAMATSNGVRAQSYPNRPVRLVVGQAAGSGSDILARLVAQRLSDRLGHPFVIENRPGAGGNIGVEAVARSPADGHTLLAITSTNAINVTLYDGLNFNVVRDIAAVASVTLTPYALVVNPSFPARTVPEFIDYARAHPAKINMASGGNGSVSHASSELFKLMTGVDVVHVPYRGSTPAHADLIGGQVQAMFDALTSSIEHVKSGRLRALAVTSAMPSEQLPGVPTVGNFVRGFEVSAWLGFGAPMNTPADIIDLLNKEINLALGDPEIRVRLIELGGDVLSTTPAEFSKIITDDTEKWARVIRAANIKI
jgi:tripartite-type tricarboxylate transporter receptor subunit TctC